MNPCPAVRGGAIVKPLVFLINSNTDFLELEQLAAPAQSIKMFKLKMAGIMHPRNRFRNSHFDAGTHVTYFRVSTQYTPTTKTGKSLTKCFTKQMIIKSPQINILHISMHPHNTSYKHTLTHLHTSDNQENLT